MLFRIKAKVFDWVHDHRAELDEKALLITFFVLVAMVGLGALGLSVSDQFNNLAGLI